MMFDNQKTLNIELQEESVTIERLIDILKKEHLREKPEMFVAGNSVRPGIIVLINDTDWELLDTISYQVQNNDNIAFISTLHGG
jgi:ubiquitin related modifier 1